MRSQFVDGWTGAVVTVGDFESHTVDSNGSSTRIRKSNKILHETKSEHPQLKR
jgi:hypothetical protein